MIISGRDNTKTMQIGNLEAWLGKQLWLGDNTLA